MQIQISWLLRSQLIWIYTVCKGSIDLGSAGQGLNTKMKKNILGCLSEAKECLCVIHDMYLCECECVAGLKCACDQIVSPSMFRSVSQSVYILDICENIFSMPF